MSIAGISLRIVVFKLAYGVWRRRREAAAAGPSAALYSVYHGLYTEAVVSSAVALAELGHFKETVQYVQRVAKTLYEAAKEVFERVKVAVQRLVELFVEAVTRVLALVNEHRAYLFLMAAAAAGAVALSVVLNLWGLVELEKLAYAASAPFVAGLADAGGRAAERFRTLAERWKVDDKEEEKKIENIINGIINAPLRGETSQSSRRPYGALLELSKSTNLPKPLVELREALKDVKDEVERDAAVVAALVLYRALVKNAEAYGEWAGWYEWARGLVEKQEFTVATSEIKRLRETHRKLEEAAEEVRRELNTVLTLYSQKRDIYEKLKSLVEVDVKKAEELAEAGYKRFSDYSNANMGTKAYAALLSIAKGGIYGHVAMLLMGEGALADIVLLTPRSAYNKAWEIAKGRGEAVDPSRVGAAGWEDRAASALLRYLLSRAVDENLMFRRVGEGFEVFRAYGGVKTHVDELKIEEVAHSKTAGEELRRFVEEAKREAPDLSGFDKAPQYVAWRATDVTTVKKLIAAATVHFWQLRWYFGLLGGPKSFSGKANITRKGVKLIATMYWPREREDKILRESRWLEYLLGRRVESWRELVDAVDWSWVLKRVEELADELKPWIGPEKMDDAEREGLARRALGELAFLVHFAETRRGMDDGRWRAERAVRLAKAVEALSGGRIAGDHAEELARAIIYYAERREERTKKRIESLAKEAGVSREEVWGIVKRVLSGEDSYVYCLARNCARDEVVRKFVEPALELIMLDKALRGKFDRERAKLIFGEMYATAIAGDGSVGPGEAMLAVGGELGGGAALLRLATLQLLNQLLSDELKFGVRVYVEEGTYRITATGENAARLKRLLAASAPSDGRKYLSDKFNEFVKEARVEVRLDENSIRLTERGLVAADLTISEGDVAVKYNVYLNKDDIRLQFRSTDRSRVELAARLLRLAGVIAEVGKIRDSEWHVVATTNKLAAGHEELRNAIANIVRKAVESGWVDAGKAEGWLEKLESGVTLMEGWPMYHMGLTRNGALVVRFSSPNPNSIEREKQRLENMGLKEGKHFTVKMPGEGRDGYVRILREGLAYAARLSVRGKDEQQRKLAADFVKYILQRAKEAGEDVRKKAEEVVEEGKAWGSLTLKDFEKEVEVNGEKYKVKVIDGEAVEEDRDGRKLLRIRITAEVGGVRSDYVMTYGRYGKLNAAVGRAYVRADAPGGRQIYAERFSALVEALTGKRPRVYRMKDGSIIIDCGREHLDGFKRFAELADAIEKWLEETSR